MIFARTTRYMSHLFLDQTPTASTTVYSLTTTSPAFSKRFPTIMPASSGDDMTELEEEFDEEESDESKAEPFSVVGIQLLQKAFPSGLSEGISWGGELKDVPREQLALFYRDDRTGIVGCVDFPGTSAGLDTLTSACHAAAFGRGGETVLDNTYRKALRLDVENFGINFSPERLGLIQDVQNALLGIGDERTLRAELYKLNVYTEGGFFKPHLDTPRAENMLGSLVIGLPVAHQGGALVVRNKEKEMKYDFSNDGSDSTVHWAAFFSDTEHEVEKVTSGHRITLTYNLYIEKEDPARRSDREITQGMVEQSNFYKVLSQQLQHEKFYPDGGILGFGLKHQYPFPTQSYRSRFGNINSMMRYLKSTDNFIRAVGVALGLEPELKIVCNVEECGITIMTSSLDDFPGSTYDDLLTAITEEFDAEVIDGYYYDGDVQHVDWVTPIDRTNIKKYDWISYGNEASIQHSYGRQDPKQN